ncbi:lipocalin-like domain-containing protein [Variovorax sp. VNK109]|uniref:lipocalin-like domain-containing protein n=1 Tax=Variovorax sp. VNK109 TaxID=3400919 RepID=UPI003C07CE76
MFMTAPALAISGGLHVPAAVALPPRTLEFPRDHGAHPDLRTEWWYITGTLRSTQAPRREFGFQVTFFRSRVDGTQGMSSAFAARQMLFAHAAVTDLQGRVLLHDQRIARAGFDIASASEQDTDIRLRDWSLRHDGRRYEAGVRGNDFTLALNFDETQPLLLQGRKGLSRKGPDATQASYYYSQPQLATGGRLSIKGQTFEVTGRAWLDHEWSEALMHPQAVGWDWIGMNLDDGSALTAFRLRTKDGQSLWDGGSFRGKSGHGVGDTYVFSPGETTFVAQRQWQSPLSRATYPVEWRIRTPADFYTVRALLDNQELDSRGSTGAIYWEGLSDLIDSSGRTVGRGYLEMTGYASPLRI